jgi:hypothetical protein
MTMTPKEAKWADRHSAWVFAVLLSIVLTAVIVEYFLNR